MSIWTTFASVGTGGLSTVYKYAAIAAVVMVLIGIAGFKGYSLGSAKSKEVIAEYIAKHDQEVTDLLGMQIVTNNKILTQVITKTQIIHDHGVTNETIANTIVPDHQFLSLGWLRTHDSAAAGNAVDPTSAADGTPSTTQANTALSTVVDNYATCEVTRTELIGLQQWITETNANIAAANKKIKNK